MDLAPARDRNSDEYCDKQTGSYACNMAGSLTWLLFEQFQLKVTREWPMKPWTVLLIRTCKVFSIKKIKMLWLIQQWPFADQ